MSGGVEPVAIIEDDQPLYDWGIENRCKNNISIKILIKKYNRNVASTFIGRRAQ
jgi:hypothetical protein